MLAINRERLSKLVGERATMRAAIVLGFVLVVRCVLRGTQLSKPY
jgi:hypothetical protein